MNVEKTKVMRISRQAFLIQIIVVQNQPDNVEYFNYLGSMITNNAKCKREIKSRIHQQIGIKFKEETSEVLHLEHSLER